MDPDWIVLMDDDGRPEPGVLERFQAECRSEAEAWLAAVYHPDGRICDINRPWVNPFWHRDVFWRTLTGKGRDGFHMSASDYDAPAPVEIDGGSFVGLFVSREGMKKAGYPDGRLFVYGEDVLFTLGLSKAGGRVLFDPALRFEHDYSTTSEADRRFRPLWKSYYLHRNLLLVYRVAAGWLFWPALLIVLPGWILKTRDHRGERWRFLTLTLRAIRDGLLKRTRIPHDRVRAWSGDGTLGGPGD